MATSFAIRRPENTRQRFNADSDSDEDQNGSVQTITSFDGRRGISSKQTKAGRSTGGSAEDGKPLVIPSQKNKDWKKEAARLRAMKQGGPQRYRPGMGDDKGAPRQYTEEELEAATRISSNAQGGLAQTKRSIPPPVQPGDKTPLGPQDSPPLPPAAAAAPQEPETEDQKALKALLKDASGQDDGEEQPEIDAIHGDTQNNFWDRHNNQQPLGEEDLFRADIESRPDSATLNDYERVPVEAFGAALLRGMYASGDTSKQKAPVQAYVPKARPNLLGIGAKELDLGEDKNSRGAKEKERQRKKESMHFVPLIKKERPKAVQAQNDLPMLPPDAFSSRSSGKDRDSKDARSSSSRSRRDDYSPPSKSSSSRRDRHRDDDDDDDRYYRSYSKSSSSSSSSRRDKDRSRDDDYRRPSSSSSRRRSRSPPRESKRSYEREKEKDRERSRDNDRYRESERDRDYSRRHRDRS